MLPSFYEGLVLGGWAVLLWRYVSLQRKVSTLEATALAQQRLNVGYTEDIGMLDVCTQTMGEQVARSAEQIDANAVDVHRLVVEVGGVMYRVERTEPSQT